MENNDDFLRLSLSCGSSSMDNRPSESQDITANTSATNDGNGGGNSTGDGATSAINGDGGDVENDNVDSQFKSLFLAGSSSNNTNIGGPVVQRDAIVPSRPRRGGVIKGTITPPFPWATNRRATIQSFKYLIQNKITRIRGRVQCKRCLKVFEMEVELSNNLSELMTYIERNRHSMYDRAPKKWMDPVLPNCEHCGSEDSVAPLLAGTKKKNINWLFLLLTQLVGLCNIGQLKYFCKHTRNHRTAAKDRLVYSTCMILCQQLLPDRFRS